MSSQKLKPTWIAGSILVLALAVTVTYRFLEKGEKPGSTHPNDNRPSPVKVAEIKRGPLSLNRTFSGTIEARAGFTVAPKVSGRIERLHVDISDTVKRGQLVAELEDDEYKQAVAEAEASLTVAEANLVEARSNLEIATRQLERTKTLQSRGIASDSTLDSAQAEFLAGQAKVKMAEATLKREEAALAAARIRLGYTKIRADWQSGDNERTVAERYVDEGNTVAANTPLLSIVELDPLIAVLMITERDYPRIEVNQEAKLRSDAFPQKIFTGRISRIAPIFKESSRQARVELTIPNPDHLLKPGMFARCTLELKRVENAISVPEPAITRRNDKAGVFLVSDDGNTVKWVEVEPGIQDGEQVQLIGAEFSGLVVTLGQQLIKNGSTIKIAGGNAVPGAGKEDSP